MSLGWNLSSRYRLSLIYSEYFKPPKKVLLAYEGFSGILSPKEHTGFNVNSFPVPIRSTRQHGACGFLSIPFACLAHVTQHSINSPFLVPPSITPRLLLLLE